MYHLWTFLMESLYLSIGPTCCRFKFIFWDSVFYLWTFLMESLYLSIGPTCCRLLSELILERHYSTNEFIFIIQNLHFILYLFSYAVIVLYTVLLLYLPFPSSCVSLNTFFSLFFLDLMIPSSFLAQSFLHLEPVNLVSSSIVSESFLHLPSFSSFLPLHPLHNTAFLFFLHSFFFLFLFVNPVFPFLFLTVFPSSILTSPLSIFLQDILFPSPFLLSLS